MNLGINQNLNHKHVLQMTKADAIGSTFGGLSGIIKGLVSGKVAILTMFSMIEITQVFDTLLTGGIGAIGGLMATKIGSWVWRYIKRKAPFPKEWRKIL